MYGFRVIFFFLLNLLLSHKPIQKEDDFIMMYPFILGFIMWIKHLLVKPFIILISEFILLEIVMCLVLYYTKSNLSFSRSVALYGNLLCSEIYCEDNKDKITWFIVILGTLSIFYHICPWSLNTDSHLSAITTLEALYFLHKQCVDYLLRW
jgi:hypothetical protein